MECTKRSLELLRKSVTCRFDDKNPFNSSNFGSCYKIQFNLLRKINFSFFYKFVFTQHEFNVDPMIVIYVFLFSDFNFSKIPFLSQILFCVEKPIKNKRNTQHSMDCESEVKKRKKSLSTWVNFPTYLSVAFATVWQFVCTYYNEQNAFDQQRRCRWLWV